MILKLVRREAATSGSAGAGTFGVHPVLERIYRARAIDNPADLDHGLAGLLPFHSLAGVSEAASLLANALIEDLSILVVGDFDADGATGCAVAVRGLRMLGARNVDFLVPNRFEFGYGLTPEIVTVAAERKPDLIVTVDNGISSVAGVSKAGSLGIPVLVTDHHLPGEQIPPAAAIVNPNLPPCGFPSKALAGVGVMFYVLSAVRAELRDRGWFDQTRAQPRLADLLDLVALGTVADVVPLDRNNRILVAQGLARIRAGRCQPGLLAMLEVAGRDHETITASDLAFALGPRLNAAGRLDDMSLGVACLLSDELSEARALAQRLDELNRQRREIESEMKAEAMASINEVAGIDTNGPPCAICVYEPHWHPGVIGIVAGRVKDRFHRPSIAFAQDGDAHLRGSARSIPGLNIRDALAAVDARHPGLIVRFGGHAMAAGLTLVQEHLERFEIAFTAAVEEQVDPMALEGALLTDGELSGRDFGLALARAIRDGGPWGAGFPEPLFEGVFRVESQRVVGQAHLKLVVAPEADGAGTSLDAIAFNALEQTGPADLGRVRLAYRLQVNHWRGRESAQLVVEQIEALPA